ncbi:MAG: PTS ascorbate transporter subunit IIC [Anaerolineae bacterium]|nr:PTS ascorbate transporter subunit IIC [Anaerolineae bacterium]
MFALILELVTTPAIILGLMALVGLLIQRKSAGEVISGTLKTILGVLIMSVGIGALINALVPIEQMFTQAFQIEGFVTFDEACVTAVQTANVGRVAGEIALTMLFGYIIHILLARFTPWKYIYLTGHMIWIHAGAFAILFHSFGLPFWLVVVLASITDGLYMTLAPALAQPFMRKITGSDEIAFGHGQTLLNVTGGWLAKLVGNPEDSAEDLKLPEGLSFFRDMAISISLIMLLVVIVAMIFAGPEFVSGLSGDQNWIVFSILQALGFAAGVLVLIHGVRMLIAEIVPAFKGIADVIVPGAKPALDCPVIYPYAPVSLMIGLITGSIGQAVAIVILGLLGWPIPIPSMIAAFFASGAGAIFGNAYGGKWGAVIGGFWWCFAGWFMISLGYQLQIFGDLASMGAEGLFFTVPDAILPAFVIWGIAKLFGLA